MVCVVDFASDIDAARLRATLWTLALRAPHTPVLLVGTKASLAVRRGFQPRAQAAVVDAVCAEVARGSGSGLFLCRLKSH